MSTKSFQDLLASFKRSNKERKLKLANKAGFPTIEKYKEYLENRVVAETTVIPVKKGVKTPRVKKTTDKPTIHIVDIIDCSTSMSGEKIVNANKGINNGIVKLKESKEQVNYTYTICDFGSRNDIKFKHIGSSLLTVNEFSFPCRGCTALYDAIKYTFDNLKSFVNKNDKVLINIYTDGDDNESYTRPSDIAKLIKEHKDTYTVTFIGTEKDVKYVINNMNIDKSNTLSYDGSGKGLAATLDATSIARSSYSKSVASGQDVSKGFYKNIKK